jgi:hypothetical protein
MAEQLHVRQQAAAAVNAALALTGRWRRAVGRSQALAATSSLLRREAEAERLRLRRERAARASSMPVEPVRDLVGFSVEGIVDGGRVSAKWANGGLRCDEALRDRALFLVDLGEELVYAEPPRRFQATLTGRPVAVALTLLRACDRVVAFEFDLP